MKLVATAAETGMMKASKQQVKIPEHATK